MCYYYYYYYYYYYFIICRDMTVLIGEGQCSPAKPYVMPFHSNCLMENIFSEQKIIGFLLGKNKHTETSFIGFYAITKIFI